MSSVVLSGDTSGTVTLTVPAVAGTNTVTIPAGTGTVAVQGVSTNIVSGTAVASTSGTSIDFTSIPSWVKRITVMFNGVSTNGTSLVMAQIGAGSVETTGYAGSTGLIFGTNQTVIQYPTTGAGIYVNAAGDFRYGSFTITSMGSNIWQFSGVISSSTAGGGSATMAYGKTLSGTLDRLRITTVNGTDAFDAGSINILYE